jgi:hypothetical protein
VVTRFGLAILIFATDIVLARLLGPAAKGRFSLVLLYSQLAALILGWGMDQAIAVVSGRGRSDAKQAMANAIIWTVVVGGFGVVLSAWLYGLGHPGPPDGPLVTLLPNLSAKQFIYSAVAIPGELFLRGRPQAFLGAASSSVLVGPALPRLILLVLIVAMAASLRLNDPEPRRPRLTAVSLAIARSNGFLSLRPSWTVLAEEPGSIARGTDLAERSSPGRTRSSRARCSASRDRHLLRDRRPRRSGTSQRARDRDVQPGRRPSQTPAGSPRASPDDDRRGHGDPIPSSCRPLSRPAAYGRSSRTRVWHCGSSCGVIAYSVVAVLTQHVTGRGRPGNATLIMVFGLATNVAANHLVPRMGINGAALASSISYGLTSILTLVIFIRLSGRGWLETVLTSVRRAGAAATGEDGAGPEAARAGRGARRVGRGRPAAIEERSSRSP